MSGAGLAEEMAVVIAALLAGRIDGQQAVASSASVAEQWFAKKLGSDEVRTRIADAIVDTALVDPWSTGIAFADAALAAVRVAVGGER